MVSGGQAHLLRPILQREGRRVISSIGQFGNLYTHYANINGISNGTSNRMSCDNVGAMYGENDLEWIGSGTHTVFTVGHFLS